MFWTDMKIFSLKIFIITFLIVASLWSQIPADRGGVLNGEGVGQATYAEACR